MHIHAVFHQISAIIGGLIFMLIGFAKIRERNQNIKTGKKVEILIFEIIFIVVGIMLIVFALGSLIYQLSRQ